MTQMTFNCQQHNKPSGSVCRKHKDPSLLLSMIKMFPRVKYFHFRWEALDRSEGGRRQGPVGDEQQQPGLLASTRLLDGQDRQHRLPAHHHRYVEQGPVTRTITTPLPYSQAFVRLGQSYEKLRLEKLRGSTYWHHQTELEEVVEWENCIGLSSFPHLSLCFPFLCPSPSCFRHCTKAEQLFSEHPRGRHTILIFISARVLLQAFIEIFQNSQIEHPNFQHLDTMIYEWDKYFIKKNWHFTVWSDTT